MVRPRKNRIVSFNPEVSYFKPRGIPLMDLDEVALTIDEREALRLADLLGLSHEEAGKEMGVSRATFGRIIQKARHIVADALINGKAINVQGGNFKMISHPKSFICITCKNKWEAPCGSPKPSNCPSCGDKNFHRILEKDC